MGSRRSAAALPAVLAALALGTPSPAVAAEGTLLLSPSSIDAAAVPGGSLPDVVVVNTTPRRLALTAYAVPARQDRAGMPAFTTGGAARAAGRGLVRLRPGRFVLAPGQRRALRLTVTARKPTLGRGAYGVVVVSAVAARREGDEEDRAVTASRLRLTANLLLRFPGPGGADVRAAGLRAEQAPRRGLRLVTTTVNRGRIHARPRAVVRVRDARGRVVARAAAVTGNVLPGARRELPATVTKVLPAGTYAARVVVTSRGRRTTRVVRFTLTAPGTLPTPDVRLGTLPVPEPSDGEAGTARVEVVNRGSAPGRAALVAEVHGPGGARLARWSHRLTGLAPGARKALGVPLPAAGEGDHRLTVTLRDGPRVLDERTVVYAPGVARPVLARALDWAAAHLPAVLAAFAALLALVTATAAARVRRLRRELDALRPSSP